MSSLRPLITIMLLAAVGVVLYMKINETEPAIPAGVPEWSVDPLQIGDAGGASGSVSAATHPPKLDAEEAPAFTPSTGAAATAAAAPAGDEAPAWTPEPLALSDPPKNGAAQPEVPANEASSPVARSAEATVSVPAMPPVPGAEPAATAAAASGSPAADVPTFTPVETQPLATADPATTSVQSEGLKSNAPAANAGVAATVPVTGATAPAAPDASQVEAAAAAGAAAVAGAAAAISSNQSADTVPAAPVSSAPAAAATSAATATAAPATTAAVAAPSKASLYSTERVAVQAALDRGELAQALLLLSAWYDDPSLTPGEAEEVNTLLSQLAGSVIYDGPPSHRLEPAYIVQAGETLAEVAKRYDIPPQLLAKVNGIAEGAALQPGQELKVVRGPFTAIVDLGLRRMTLMLDRRYAGKFTCEVDPSASIEDGQWKVEQKELTPVAGGLYGQPAGAAEDRSLLLTSEGDAGKTLIIRGPGSGDPASIQPAGRVIRLKSNDIADLYDILSEGSRVTVRR